MPLLGAVLTGGGLGPAYTVCAVLGAVAAAWLSGRSGLWWVATAAPAVVLLVALVARAATDSGSGPGSGTSATLATHALAWTAHAFPVMVIVTVAVLLVVLVHVVREKGHGRG